MTPLAEIADRFEGRPPEDRQKKNVIEQNKESMAVLTGMMGGVSNNPLRKKSV